MGYAVLEHSNSGRTYVYGFWLEREEAEEWLKRHRIGKEHAATWEIIVYMGKH